MDELKKYIGEEIKRYRKALNMTTTELGILSDTSQSTISGIERGDRFATIESMIKICEVLGITLYDVLPEKYKNLDMPKPTNERINGIMNRLSSDDMDTIESLIVNHLSLLRLVNELNPEQKKHMSNFLKSLLNNE